MSTDTAFLKCAVLGLLEAVADEHPVGHQQSKAARHLLLSRLGAPVEIMFEKNADSPPNIWCHEKAAGTVLIAAQRPRRYPSSALWIKRGADGELLYGRHSALQNMPQLGEADLVCFTLASVKQVGEIIDRLRNVTPAELS